MASLADFAKGLNASRCWVCDLPVAIAAEVLEGYKAGLRARVMTKWLRDEHNIDLSSSYEQLNKAMGRHIHGAHG